MITDRLGLPLQIGDYVVYSTMIMDHPGLRIGMVKVIMDRGIKVQGIGYRNHFPELQKRLGTLPHTDRVLRLAPEQVPEGYRRLLDPESQEPAPVILPFEAPDPELDDDLQDMLDSPSYE